MQLKIDSPPTIPWIQALRGIAAVLVVITHSSRALTSPLGQEYFWDLFVHGALGVDLFFIISGFIMVLTTQKCDGSKTYVADFVIKRFSRIWPLLFVVSMVYLLVHWLRNEGLSSRYLGEILSQLAFRPVNPSPTLFFQMPIDVAWTLCFEAFFYAVIAISLLSVKWRWWIVAALLAPGLVIYPMLTESWNLSFYHEPAILTSHYANLAVNPMVWEFVLGMLAGQLYLSQWKGPPRWVAVILVMFAMAAFVTVPITHMPSLYGPTIEYGGLTMFIAFTLLVVASKSMELPIARWMVWLGTISFSVYLSHRLGFIPAEELVQWLNVRDPSLREWSSFALHIVFGVTAGAVFHYGAEAPLSAWTRNSLLALRKYLSGKRSAQLAAKGQAA